MKVDNLACGLTLLSRVAGHPQGTVAFVGMPRAFGHRSVVADLVEKRTLPSASKLILENAPQRSTFGLPPPESFLTGRAAGVRGRDAAPALGAGGRGADLASLAGLGNAAERLFDSKSWEFDRSGTVGQDDDPAYRGWNQERAREAEKKGYPPLPECAFLPRADIDTTAFKPSDAIASAPGQFLTYSDLGDGIALRSLDSQRTGAGLGYQRDFLVLLDGGTGSVDRALNKLEPHFRSVVKCGTDANRDWFRRIAADARELVGRNAGETRHGKEANALALQIWGLEGASCRGDYARARTSLCNVDLCG